MTSVIWICFFRLNAYLQIQQFSGSQDRVSESGLVLFSARECCSLPGAVVWSVGHGRAPHPPPCFQSVPIFCLTALAPY